jgi:hypothetical protein
MASYIFLGKNNFGKQREVIAWKGQKFNISIEFSDQLTTLPGGITVKYYMVAANGFIIASFVSAQCMSNYINEIKCKAFAGFPPEIMEQLYFLSQQSEANKKAGG